MKHISFYNLIATKTRITVRGLKEKIKRLLSCDPNSIKRLLDLMWSFHRYQQISLLINKFTRIP